MKTITVQDLQRLEVLQKIPAGLHPGVVCHRLGRYYCKPVQDRKQCTLRCQECKEKLTAIVTKIYAKSVRNVTDPIGLLVWSCREMVAELDEQMEAASVAPSRKTDWLGQPVDANPFALFVSSFDVETEK